MLRIGTSGWNYPSGKGSWNGLFYPARRGRRAGLPDFDELSWYAEHFDTVEVNSTFYGQPRPEVTRAWALRTPSNFEFSIKLYQKFTHPRMFKERVGKGLPGEARNDAALVDALVSFDCRVVKKMTHGSHTVFLGQVEQMLLGQKGKALLYSEGQYAKLASLTIGEPLPEGLDYWGF